MEAWVYILRCADGTLYTGWTCEPESRVRVHNSGKGARYTAGRLPVDLVYCERASSKGDALRRERAIKKMSRKEKERLIALNTKQSGEENGGGVADERAGCWCVQKREDR